MNSRIDIDAFLARRKERDDLVLFDVRTPAEFDKGHIPGARNLPLFTNEERVVIGTLYKQQGRHDAILAGLDLIGPKMRRLVEQVEHIAGSPEARGDELIYVHCWRGGMRSLSVAWLLSFYGYTCVTIDGGYKAFRRHAQAVFAREDFTFVLLGGPTGSKKTELLAHLAHRGEQVIDLEGLANHRGSAFGHLLKETQPSVEHFENMLAVALLDCDDTRPIWLEDESRMVGSAVIPSDLFAAMKRAPIFAIRIPREERIAHLVALYGRAKKRALVEAFTHIRKKLGGQKFTSALDALDALDFARAADIALSYYDKAYAYGLNQRDEPLRTDVHFDKEPGGAETLDDRARVLATLLADRTRPTSPPQEEPSSP